MTAGIVGVGYQGATAAGLAGWLADSGVGTLVDVRLTPLSRKPGFSKRAWADILREHGIGYLHLPALGNPKDNRAGFADAPETPAGREARDRYRALLRTEPASAALGEIAALAAEQRVALLCFEQSEDHCHRAEVLRAVRARLEGPTGAAT
ncbi:DUF488 domain-containing protein [Naasia aerilata]|uniref:DUF488 domain-containing protein n=1 Tax=Naasia aerilata TaxID=1162966 RepID=A0ABM8GAG1_9MICO|nr:DUF488 domain-containing protein [Naasia aerilata]BDZ45206.1 hypothetical protein GCM10025866_11150 [Naasia aerilata]